MAWADQIEAAFAARPAPVRASTYLDRRIGCFSFPVWVSCEDGQVYVVKAPQDGRPTVARTLTPEHVVGRVGACMGAAIPVIGYVELPTDLLEAEPAMAHYRAGIAHGSVLLQDCSESLWVNHFNVPENRHRYALIAALCSMFNADDHQFLYQNNRPRLVYSVDHGFFFPGGAAWTAESLRLAPAAVLDPLFEQCGFTPQDLEITKARLEGLTAADIAAAAAGPLEEWGIDMDERVAIAEYVDRRRTELLESL